MERHLKGELRHYLTHEVELLASEIATASSSEIFRQVLAYEGHGLYADITIKNWIKHIYGVDLDEIEET